VLGIEESIWSPMYGLKGVIDVSVEAQIKQEHFEPATLVLPLEVKTGKESTIPHKAQVLLYMLLMSEYYRT
jgi:DNA replication ATP-dependent helicase Dna2